MLDKDAEYLTTNNQDDIQDVLMMLGCGAGVNDSDQAHGSYCDPIRSHDEEVSQW
jgi:uncharacterized lipoprotein NlpE involved in copper resistance